jgi:phage protein U
MIEVMMAIGRFKFTANTAAYQEVKRVSEYRWSEQQRIARDPAMQYTGKGRETIDLSGVIYPAEFNSGANQVNEMRKVAADGKPLTLISAQGSVGEINGDWIIKRIEETGTVFAAGGSPRKIEFRMSLQFYGADKL